MSFSVLPKINQAEGTNMFLPYIVYAYTPRLVKKKKRDWTSYIYNQKTCLNFAQWKRYDLKRYENFIKWFIQKKY
jgi:hypothetical protein